MTDIKVGDRVRIVNDNEYWNGTEAKVTAIEPGAEFKYTLELLTATPTGHFQPGSDVGGWQSHKVEKIPTALEKTIDGFHRPLDVFYSPTTGAAVVMAPNGKLIRILADGTVDRP